MLIAHPKTRQSGFTIVELMIGVVILGILAAVAVPNFQVWMQNGQISTAAEAITNGMQRARAEAVARNANVEFVLGADSSWTVRIVGGANIESRLGNEGSRDVTVTTVPAATTITFNNFGGVISNFDASPSIAQVDFTSAGGNRPLRVNVGVGGNAKLCDPNLSTGVRAC